MRSLINNSRTDKNTTHSYLEVYELFLHRIKSTAKNVLEIGTNEGGGIDLLAKYFQNAHIYGLESSHYPPTLNDLIVDHRIHFKHNTDAYTESTVNFFKDINLRFDCILDDGPHSPESQLYVVKHYIDLLSDDGILIIEDIYDYATAHRLANSIPEQYRKAAFIIDRRDVKGRYDDLLFVFDKHYL